MSFLLRTRKPSNNYLINFWKLQRNVKYYKSYFYLIFQWPPHLICPNVFKSFKCGENCRLDMWAPADIFGDVCSVSSFWKIRVRPALTSCMIRSSACLACIESLSLALASQNRLHPSKKEQTYVSLFPLEHFSHQWRKELRTACGCSMVFLKALRHLCKKFCLG